MNDNQINDISVFVDNPDVFVPFAVTVIIDNPLSATAICCDIPAMLARNVEPGIPRPACPLDPFDCALPGGGYGELRGSVVDDATKLAISCAAVVAVGPGNFTQVAIVDVNGAYFFREVPAGEYAVEVNAPGFEGAQDVVQASEDTVATADFDLTAGGPAPISGAQVVATSSRGPGGFTRTTDANGLFLIAGLPLDDYSTTASVAGLPSQTKVARVGVESSGGRPTVVNFQLGEEDVPVPNGCGAPAGSAVGASRVDGAWIILMVILMMRSRRVL